MPLLLLLSATTGVIDAVSVLGLGKVFTANMTGNIVFLGLAFAGTAGFAIGPSLTALLFFLAGAAIGGRIYRVSGPARLRRWAITGATAEAVLLTAAAVVALGYSTAALSQIVGQYATIALMALAMGLRNATMRELNAPDFSTTVLTTILTAIAADSSLAGGKNPGFAHRLASVAAIFSGAAVGALMVMRVGLVVPLLFAASLALIGLMIVVRHGPERLRTTGSS